MNEDRKLRIVWDCMEKESTEKGIKKEETITEKMKLSG